MPTTDTPETTDEVSDANISQFLSHLEDLRRKKDSEDHGRAERLEREIEEARRQRQARRMARSRSGSPEKTTPGPAQPSQPALASQQVLASQPALASQPSLTQPGLASQRPTANRLFDQSPVLSPQAESKSSQAKTASHATLSQAETKAPAHVTESSLSHRISRFEALDAPPLSSSPASPKTAVPVETKDATAVPVSNRIEHNQSAAFEPAQTGTSKSSASPTTKALPDSAPADQEAAVTKTIAAHREDALNTLTRRTSRLSLFLDTASGNKPSDEAEKSMAEREGERLSRFLSAGRRSPARDTQSYTSLQPSPSMRVSASPSGASPIALSRSPSLSPDRSRYSISPTRQSWYSTIGGYGASDDDRRLSMSSGSSSRSGSPTMPRSPTKVSFVQSAMLKRDGSTSPSKRLSMVNLRPAPAVLQRPESPDQVQVVEISREADVGPARDAIIEEEEDSSVKTPSTPSPRRSIMLKPHAVAEIAEKQETETRAQTRTSPSPRRSIMLRPQEEPAVKAAEEAIAEEREEGPSTPSTPTSRRSLMMHSPEKSPSPIRLRQSQSSLHRASSSLTLSQAAVDRFRARDVELTKHKKEPSVVSQYGDSKFQPSPTYRSLLEREDANEEGILKQPKYGSNKENLGSNSPVHDGASVLSSTPKSPLLSRSPSRSPNNKRWTPTKSSWMESALMKSGDQHLRTAGKPAKDIFE